MSDATEFNKQPICGICGEIVILAHIHVKEGGECFHFGCCSGSKSNEALAIRVTQLESRMHRRGSLYQTLTIDGQELMLRAPIEAVITLPPGTLGGGQSDTEEVEKAVGHIRQSNALSDVEILRKALAKLLDRVNYVRGSRVRSDCLGYVLSEATIAQACKALEDTAL